MPMVASPVSRACAQLLVSSTVLLMLGISSRPRTGARCIHSNLFQSNWTPNMNGKLRAPQKSALNSCITLTPVLTTDLFIERRQRATVSMLLNSTLPSILIHINNLIITPRAGEIGIRDSRYLGAIPIAIDLLRCARGASLGVQCPGES